MIIHTILFNLFASLALITGIGVIVSKNPVHSVIFLILVFCNATGLLLLFKITLNPVDIKSDFLVFNLFFVTILFKYNS